MPKGVEADPDNVAQGCQTYSQYADVLYANPAKSEDNLDVVTTVNFQVFYGAMGIGGNPQVHPYGDVAHIGYACNAVEECGDPDGNVCIKPVNGAQKVCGVVALDKAECPQGSKLTPLAQGSTVKTFAWLP